MDERGEAALEQVWASPESLPDLAELEDPAGWLARVSEPVRRPITAISRDSL